jgi:hypothetical protein
VGHGVTGVREQVQEDLASLLPVGVNERRILGEFQHDGDLLFAEVVLNEFHGLGQFLADVHRRDFLLAPAREREQVRDSIRRLTVTSGTSLAIPAAPTHRACLLTAGGSDPALSNVGKKRSLQPKVIGADKLR